MYAEIQTQGESRGCLPSSGLKRLGVYKGKSGSASSSLVSLPSYCWDLRNLIPQSLLRTLVCHAPTLPHPPPPPLTPAPLHQLSFLSCHSLTRPSADPSLHLVKVTPLSLLRFVLSVLLLHPRRDCGCSASLSLSLLFL